MINWQPSKQGIRWPVSPDRIAGSGVDPSRSNIFEVIRWQLTTFQMIAGSSVFFKNVYKYVVFKSPWPSTIKILTSNLPRTRKFRQLFKNTGWEDLFLPWSGVGHALRPIYMVWLVKIWQVSSCGKFMQHLETCLLWQLKLAEFCVNLWCFLMSFSTGCAKWNTAAIKSLLLFISGLFIGFLVEKCVTCQSRKSDFGWHRFRFSPCLIRKRSLKVSSDSGLTW